jgi:hypothetical protein
MRDDFSALDLFYAAEDNKSARRKLLAQPRRKVRQAARRMPLTAAFLPLIAKMKRKQANFTLQGWPVSLSWSAPRPFAREDFSDLL